ncbi:RNA-binding domain-containing protein, partial [Proteus vulgaris]
MQNLEKILNINEGIELECKQAGGRDGKGELPFDFWATYSAMANTQGGKVLLGVKENKGIFSVVGIEKIEKVKTDLFNTLNNKDKVSINLLDDSMVYIECINGKNIIVIDIPQATTKERPVYLDNNPLKGTFVRLHEGDRKCPEETIKSMLSEQVNDTLDDRIFENFTIDDLDETSIQVYRTMLAGVNPTHVWLELNNFDFIKSLKGWRRDRKKKIEGLTLAGLLMFGKWTSIQEAMPNYFIEYQEIDDTSPNRWNDRIVPDGTWSGNLFDFYRKAYRKLTEDLKVPFNLNSGIRKEDSPVHVALREALVNTLVHSDYSGKTPIKIIKKNGLFYFKNPGIMRVPFSTAKLGGHSDCRNRYLHQMFLMVGLGERAGSGFPKILSGWKSQHWSEPQLNENRELHYTALELKTENLIHPDTLKKLKNICKGKLDTLNELEILILSEALENDLISHDFIKKKASSDTRTITLALSKLVKSGFLNSDGINKNKRYFLPSYKPVKPENKEGYELLKTSFIHPPKDFLFENKEIYQNQEGDELLEKIYTREQCYPYFVNDNYLEQIISTTLNDIKINLVAIDEVLNKIKPNHKLDDEQSHKLNDEQSHKLNDEQSHKLND